jgi:hypothetical protein
MKADDLAKLPNPLKPTYVIDGFPMPQRIVPGRLGKRHVRLTEPPPFPLTEPQYFTRPAVLLLIGPPFVDPAQTTGAGIIEETHLGRQARPKPPQEAPVRATPGELRPSHRTKPGPSQPRKDPAQPPRESRGPSHRTKPGPSHRKKAAQSGRQPRAQRPAAASRAPQPGFSVSGRARYAARSTSTTGCPRWESPGASSWSSNAPAPAWPAPPPISGPAGPANPQKLSGSAAGCPAAAGPPSARPAPWRPPPADPVRPEWS